MSSFKAETYLSFSSTSFKEIFSSDEPVWAALSKIKTWILSCEDMGKISGEVSEDAFLENREQIFIGKGSVVESGAYIRGPAWIGENCVIRHGAYLRGNVIAAKGVVIGHDTEVKNAIFLEGSHAAHFAYVGDAILGARVNLGAGVKIANLKLSRKEIIVEGVSTGLVKFGAIIGDGCQIGCNSVLNPGTVMGRGTDVSALVNIEGLIPANSFITSNQSMAVRPKKVKTNNL